MDWFTIFWFLLVVLILLHWFRSAASWGVVMLLTESGFRFRSILGRTIEYSWSDFDARARLFADLIPRVELKLRNRRESIAVIMRRRPEDQRFREEVGKHLQLEPIRNLPDLIRRRGE